MIDKGKIQSRIAELQAIADNQDSVDDYKKHSIKSVGKINREVFRESLRAVGTNGKLSVSKSHRFCSGLVWESISAHPAQRATHVSILFLIETKKKRKNFVFFGMVNEIILINLLNHIAFRHENLSWQMKIKYSDGAGTTFMEILFYEFLPKRVKGRIRFRMETGEVTNYQYVGLNESSDLLHVFDILLDVSNLEIR